MLIQGVGTRREIFEFHDGLLHSKTFTIDRVLSLIGSTNIDLRSFDLNYENDILLRDDDVTEGVCGRQQAYVEQSDPVTIDDVNSWWYTRRIWNNVVATIGPIF